MKRSVKVNVENDALGFWEVVCAECPLAPHLQALGKKPVGCMSGVQTNCQGAVPIAKCQHYKPDSLDGKKNALTIECRYEQPDMTRDAGVEMNQEAK